MVLSCLDDQYDLQYCVQVRDIAALVAASKARDGEESRYTDGSWRRWETAAWGMLPIERRTDRALADCGLLPILVPTDPAAVRAKLGS